MRVTLGVLFVAVALALCLPASAQERDPFDPLLSEDSGGTTTTSGGTDPEAPAPVEPAPDNERMANTGTNVVQYVGLGLALIGVGGATILVSMLLRTPGRRDGRIPQRGTSVA